MRAVPVSMGYQKAITSALTAPAKGKRHDMSAMTKKELIEAARSYGLDSRGFETNAALREAIRQRRPPEQTKGARGNNRAQHIAGYTSLNKPLLVILVQGALLDSSGTKDALQLRLKAWAASEGPIPPGAP